MAPSWALLLAFLACAMPVALCATGNAAVFVNPHNGETFYFNEPHYTVDPNATVATFEDQIPCVCSDADPRSEDLIVTYNCYHQALYGNCDAPFMAYSTEELTEQDGYCMMTCGRCDCCTSAFEVVQKTGNTKFLAALKKITSDDILAYLKMTGLVGTLLVPSDAAWTAAEAKYGDALTDPEALLQIFKYHFLPPEPRTRGLWTTPFFAVGAKLYTSSDAVRTITTVKAAIPANTTSRGGITGIELLDYNNNSATIEIADLRACKTVVDIIDAVLWPFEESSSASGNGTFQLSTELDVGSCDLLPNALINGTTLVDGATNRLATPGACCDACSALENCNLWTYCPLAGGCRFPAGDTLRFGECSLQNSPELSNGEALVWADSGFAAVPVLTGYITQLADSVVTAKAPAAGTTSSSTAATVRNSAIATADP